MQACIVYGYLSRVTVGCRAYKIMTARPPSIFEPAGREEGPREVGVARVAVAPVQERARLRAEEEPHAEGRLAIGGNVIFTPPVCFVWRTTTGIYRGACK